MDSAIDVDSNTDRRWNRVIARSCRWPDDPDRRLGTARCENRPCSHPTGLFGPAWTIILGLAAWSAVVAWNAASDADTRRSVVILFATNALFHLLWSPLFFRLRRPDWALIEVVFLWGSLVALVAGLWPISHLASLLILPYLIWVSFAAWLNSAIVKLNGPFGSEEPESSVL